LVLNVERDVAAGTLGEPGQAVRGRAGPGDGLAAERALDRQREVHGLEYELAQRLEAAVADGGQRLPGGAGHGAAESRLGHGSVPWGSDADACEPGRETGRAAERDVVVIVGEHRLIRRTAGPARGASAGRARQSRRPGRRRGCGTGPTPARPRGP